MALVIGLSYPCCLVLFGLGRSGRELRSNPARCWAKNSMVANTPIPTTFNAFPVPPADRFTRSGPKHRPTKR